MIRLQEMPLEPSADDDVCHYKMNEEGRLILDTIHGTVFIDVRREDVNAFTFHKGNRVDFLLIQENT